MTTLPNFKVKTLKEAKSEMLKFGITEKVSTLSQAKTLLFAKRGELAQAKAADKASPGAKEATSTTVAPVVTPKIASAVSKPTTKPTVVADYLGVRYKQLSCVYLTKAELAILSVCDDTTSVLEAVISILSKTEYREGRLLSNAYAALQQNKLTKDLDPRDILDEIKSSKAIALKSEGEKRAFANLRVSSK
jgi:hypothetical protein